MSEQIECLDCVDKFNVFLSKDVHGAISFSTFSSFMCDTCQRSAAISSIEQIQRYLGTFGITSGMFPGSQDFFVFGVAVKKSVIRDNFVSASISEMNEKLREMTEAFNVCQRHIQNLKTRREPYAQIMSCIDSSIENFNRYSQLMSFEEFECSICRGNVQKGDFRFIVPPCGHSFHSHCIAGWHASSQVQRDGPSCPLCRAKYSINQEIDQSSSNV